MLTTFIIICVVFCLIAMAAVALPLWFGGRKAADAEDRHETILGILRQQAADLEKEREAGRIDLDEYEESRLELERRVLEETARDTDAEVKDQSKVARIIAVVLAVVIPASAVFGYLALGRYNAMDPAFLEAVQNQQRQTQGHSQSDMMAAIERLQNRLKETPDDAQTWYMLARTLSNVGRFAEALDAFQTLCRTEGILPALESSHALAWVLRHHDELPAGGHVVVNLSGRGDKDMDIVEQHLHI